MNDLELTLPGRRTLDDQRSAAGSIEEWAPNFLGRENMTESVPSIFIFHFKMHIVVHSHSPKGCILQQLKNAEHDVTQRLVVCRVRGSGLEAVR